MLGKLLKYEIRATSRTFLTMYALLVVFAIVNKFFFSINSKYFSIPQAIAMFAFVAIVIGICVMTLIVTIQRFNKNLLTDEGYLSFTLPVKTHTHIDAKMIVSFMWGVLSFIVSFISIIIIVANHDFFIKLPQLFSALGRWFAEYGPTSYVVTFECVILCIVTILSSIISVYLAIAIGNMSSKHKLLVGIGAYVGLGIIEQIVASIILVIFGSSMERFIDSFGHASSITQLHVGGLVLLGITIFTAVFGVAYYFATDWLLNKKLNLE